jgi:hypothetical protein
VLPDRLDPLRLSERLVEPSDRLSLRPEEEAWPLVPLPPPWASV